MDGLRDQLLQLSPSARDRLRTALIRDDRDEIAQVLLRFRDPNGDGWAEIIDTLTMYPDVRRQVVRLLAEINAEVTLSRENRLDCGGYPVRSRFGTTELFELIENHLGKAS